MSRLSQLRKESGLSQDDLARKIGVSRGSISFYENGQRVPNLDALLATSKYFNVSIDYLVGASNKKGSPIYSDRTFEIAAFRRQVQTLKNAISEYVSLADDLTDKIRLLQDEIALLKNDEKEV